MPAKMKIEFRTASGESFTIDVDDSIGIRRDSDSGRLVMETAHNVSICHLSRKGFWHVDFESIKDFRGVPDVALLASPIKSVVFCNMG